MSDAAPTELQTRGEKDVWSSRAAFYFAAVGAAVGFGNVWRFPGLSYQYGGGAFFIPYLLALFIVGIPILVLEIALGQYWQTGDAGVFGHFHRRLTGVGISSVCCGFIVVTYYSMLIAWVANAFFDSFTDNAPWTNPDVNSTIAIDYFFGDIIGMKTLNEGDNSPTRMVGKNIGYSAMSWFIVFCCLGPGVKWTGRISYFTMGLPIILLFVFLGRSLSLEGSEDGIAQYIGQWDTTVLREQGDVWSTAVSQIFFSIGVTFGIMTAFGGHCKQNEPAFVNSVVIALANSCFSFISGFAVFGALGHLAYRAEVEFGSLDVSGFSLVFGTWPVIMGTLPGGIHWVRLLFFNLFLLGIDSAFALLEAAVTVIGDTPQLRKVPKWIITASLCLLAFLLSLMYACDAGLFFLDVIDYYINFIMILVGFFETFGAGWMYGIDKQFQSLGHKVVLCYMFANFGAVILASGIWFGVKNGDQVWAGFVALFLFYIIGNMFTCFFMKQKMNESPDQWTWKSMWWELAFSNIFELRDLIQPVVGIIPGVWCFLIKQFLPHLLIVLFVNLAQTKTDSGESVFGHYGGYEVAPYQVLGILSVAFALFLFIIGVVFPDIYTPFNTLSHDYSQDDDSPKEVEVNEADDKVEKMVEDVVDKDDKSESSGEEIHA